MPLKNGLIRFMKEYVRLIWRTERCLSGRDLPRSDWWPAPSCNKWDLWQSEDRESGYDLAPSGYVRLRQTEAYALNYGWDIQLESEA